MARPKRRSKIRRYASRTKKLMLRLLGHTIMRDILVFLLLLGIFYFAFMGVLTVALRTDSFWMAVTSGSMKHDGERWRDYYTALGDNSYKFPIQGGFERGDILVIQGVNSVSEISVGDVLIIDRGPGVTPLTHRVVEIWEENGEVRLRTKGDNNLQSYGYFYEGGRMVPGDYPITPNQILGKVVFVIPKLGYIPLWFQRK
jgi:signal peptidase I